MKADWRHIIIATILSLAYIYLSIDFAKEEKFLPLLIPFVILIGLFIFLRMDLAMLLLFFTIPLSVPLREYFPGLNIDMYLPTEPILVFLTALFFIKIFLDKIPDKPLLTHPVSLMIYLSLIWMFITSATSSLPGVSFKFFASRIWFIVPFYFLAALLFGKAVNIKKYIFLYGLGLIIVIFYTINKHMAYGLNDQEASNWVCSPFYNDHTAYGAALVMIMFALVPSLFDISSKKVKVISIGMLSIILFALVFSYSRAAWLSVIGALGVLVLVLLKIRFKWVATLAVISIGAIMFFYSDISQALEKNEQDSSGNFSQHISSITNITTDASNVERLNRWSSAIRMFKEKPVFGWGPGTYMFQYAPFQYSREKTIISTNFGDGGNAHSEYLGPLAESGIPGTLFFLLIGIFALITGFRVYHNSPDKEIKRLALYITLGLISYLLHGFLNNFLDTDKLSVLFWGFIAILVRLDLDMKRKLKKESLEM